MRAREEERREPARARPATSRGAACAAASAAWISMSDVLLAQNAARAHRAVVGRDRRSGGSDCRTRGRSDCRSRRRRAGANARGETPRARTASGAHDPRREKRAPGRGRGAVPGQAAALGLGVPLGDPLAGPRDASSPASTTRASVGLFAQTPTCEAERARAAVMRLRLARRNRTPRRGRARGCRGRRRPWGRVFAASM